VPWTPAVPLKIYAASPVEPDPFLFQQQPLEPVIVVARPDADPAQGIDHPLPWDAFSIRYRVQGISHLPRVTS
jgi:hypothetical protein